MLHNSSAGMGCGLGRLGKSRLAAVDQQGVVLRGMDTAAQHVAVMALQGIAPAEAGIATGLYRQLDRLDGLIGYQELDLPRPLGRYPPLGRRLQQQLAGKQLAVDPPDDLLETWQGSQRGPQVG